MILEKNFVFQKKWGLRKFSKQKLSFYVFDDFDVVGQQALLVLQHL